MRLYGAMTKKVYVYGIEMIECRCGVWRANESQLPCWNHGLNRRRQMTSEAVAQLQQSIRNMGYVIFRAVLKILIKEPK